jgi:hypothetical protein
MHHAHVNYKEHEMEPITLERFLNEPDLGRRLHAAARRARSRAMHRLVKKLIARYTPESLPGGWLARLG